MYVLVVRLFSGSGGERVDRTGGDGERAATKNLKPIPKENGEAKGQGGPNKMDVLFVDRPQGTLPARQALRLCKMARKFLWTLKQH